MADRLIKAETLTDIADAIRERTETTATINPRDFASHIRTLEGEKTEPYDEAVTVDDGATVVFDEDYTEGYKEGEVAGYNSGVEAGRQAEHTEFMNMYQREGNRTVYTNGFSDFDDNTFKPIWDIRPTTASNIFANSLITDLKGILERRKVVLDFSQVTQLSTPFANSEITHVGVIDLSAFKTTACTVLQNARKLVWVEKLIVHSELGFSGGFSNCEELEHLIVEGVITKNGLNMQWSTKLSKASITSIINCLSTTSSGTSITLSKDAVNKAFETSEGANDGTTSAEWTSLIGTRSNWTIGLA